MDNRSGQAVVVRSGRRKKNEAVLFPLKFRTAVRRLSRNDRSCKVWKSKSVPQEREFLMLDALHDGGYEALHNKRSWDITPTRKSSVSADVTCKEVKSV